LTRYKDDSLTTFAKSAGLKSFVFNPKIAHGIVGSKRFPFLGFCL
jgi:hypothetical protein